MALDTGLRGKRALVTGGASGIGRAIALALAGEGADVAIADRAPVASVLAEISARGVKARGIAADVSFEDEVVRMVGEAASAFGGLDLYVNNAAGAWHEPLTRVTRAALERTLATNVSASIFACREAAKIFIAAGGGAILAVASTAIVSAQPRETAYRASKAALKAHIEVAAVELAPFGIRVNLLTPGATDTPFVADAPAEQRRRALSAVPLRREARPEEMAPAALFLLSDRLAGYVTGSELVVDGGLRLRPIFGGSDDDLRALNLGW
ncbi:MAG TPA: SDR family NAD(P)-dependent oxidoreductase [Bauldia sp.]|nr:SDR family NAD(P)-dependent oxidoreductase [Bauldia sp.]